VRQYQNTLDSILTSHSALKLERCTTHCVHCGIRFLTDPRNAWRRNLRCPFGCRQHHRKQRSNHRSTAYYQTAEGKVKKEIQNAKRKQKAARGEQQSCCPQEDKPQPSPDRLPEDMQLVLDEVVLTPDIVESSPTLPYLTTVIRLIEGRPLGQNDLVAHLLEALRQHSMAYRRRTDYVLRFLHQHPP
jgi:hypothetical protein